MADGRSASRYIRHPTRRVKEFHAEGLFSPSRIDPVVLTAFREHGKALDPSIKQVLKSAIRHYAHSATSTRRGSRKHMLTGVLGSFGEFVVFRDSQVRLIPESRSRERWSREITYWYESAVYSASIIEHCNVAIDKLDDILEKGLVDDEGSPRHHITEGEVIDAQNLWYRYCQGAEENLGECLSKLESLDVSLDPLEVSSFVPDSKEVDPLAYPGEQINCRIGQADDGGNWEHARGAATRLHQLVADQVGQREFAESNPYLTRNEEFYEDHAQGRRFTENAPRDTHSRELTDSTGGIEDPLPAASLHRPVEQLYTGFHPESTHAIYRPEHRGFEYRRHPTEATEAHPQYPGLVRSQVNQRNKFLDDDSGRAAVVANWRGSVWERQRADARLWRRQCSNTGVRHPFGSQQSSVDIS